ncbi:MAG: methyltransferase domain-containing protein, partial [Candidatus Altiarchaeota archaeon]|nr:methyltransferase domain-containing protein [Candidatus Altiarchaeota archaeon]
MEYSTVTELPGQKASKQQLLRLYTRYKFASQYCVGKRVLELACGGGLGLGLLAEHAREVVAADVDERILSCARKTYGSREKIATLKLDANKRLPFDDSSFDTIILYEALYYLDNPGFCIGEAWRLLKDGGVFLTCLPNKSVCGFIPSPLSRRYFSQSELKDVLTVAGFNDVRLLGGSPVVRGVNSSLISTLKSLALTVGVIPKT